MRKASTPNVYCWFMVITITAYTVNQNASLACRSQTKIDQLKKKILNISIKPYIWNKISVSRFTDLRNDAGNRVQVNHMLLKSQG